MIDLALNHSTLSHNHLPLGVLVSLDLNCKNQGYEYWPCKRDEVITFLSLAHMTEGVFPLLTLLLEDAEGVIMWWY